MQDRQKRRRTELNGGQPHITDFITIGKPPKVPRSGTPAMPNALSRVTSPLGIDLGNRRNLNVSLNLNSSKKPTIANVDLELTSSDLAKSAAMKRAFSGINCFNSVLL